VSLIPQAEHTARSYPFKILANLTLPAVARACGARGGMGAGVQGQGGAGLQRLGRKGDAGSGVEAQGRHGLAALGVRGCEAQSTRGSSRAGMHRLH
jgi:hypothetical protein